MKNHRLNHKGFTLAEAMMAMVVLSIAAAGLIIPFSSAAAVQGESTTQTLGAKLASDLLETIITANFSQIVAAYNGYSDLVDTKFSRSVTCGYINVPGQAGIVSPNFIKITVQVYVDGREVAKLTTLKSK